MISFRPWLTCLTSKSAFLCCLLLALVGSPADVSAKWNWKDVSADEAVLKLKNWPGAEQCRMRKAMAPNYSRENTVFRCPRWVGDDESRTHFRVQELMPGYYWGGANSGDFSEHVMFRLKGNWFKFFKNPNIKVGQKTKCFNDNECSFQRIEFSVKGRECQWIYYTPDLGTTDGWSGRSETPYSLEIFTCQTSVPITKEHIEMEPGKVTVTFPGVSNKNSTPNDTTTTETSRNRFPNFYPCCVSVMRSLTLGAERGEAIAQRKLGSRYANGQGVKQNFQTAVKWYTQSAKQGDIIAQVSLGQIYADGNQVVPKDLQASLYWYRLAAEQGDLNAQFILGQAHAQGNSVVPKNYETALKWYRLAAKQGDDYARMEVERLEKKITSKKASPPSAPKSAPKTNFGKNFAPKSLPPKTSNKVGEVSEKPISNIQKRLEVLKQLEKNGLISSEEARKKREAILGEL